MLPKISHMFRLVKDVDSRFSTDGKQICSLYLVASEKYKDKESQIWLSATAFGKTAEFIVNVKKGQRIFCTGKLKTDEWTNNQGEKQSRITMIIDSFEYVEKRDDNQTSTQQPAQSQSQQGVHNNNINQNVSRQAPQMPNIDEFDDINDQVPF